MSMIPLRLLNLGNQYNIFTYKTFEYIPFKWYTKLTEKKNKFTFSWYVIVHVHALLCFVSFFFLEN